MILINLLPHREERRQRRKKAFYAGLGISAVVGIAVAGVWYLILQEMIGTQQERNAYLSTEIKKLEGQIKDIATLKAEIESLKARQKAVEDLQTDRNLPVHLLNELVKQTPEGVYLTAIRQDGQVVAVNGIAQTNERVSEFLRNTAYNSAWLERPELVEIKAANVTTATREQKRLFDFSVRVSIKRPGEAASAPAGASAPSAVRGSRRDCSRFAPRPSRAGCAPSAARCECQVRSRPSGSPCCRSFCIRKLRSAARNRRCTVAFEMWQMAAIESSVSPSTCLSTQTTRWRMGIRSTSR